MMERPVSIIQAAKKRPTLVFAGVLGCLYFVGILSHLAPAFRPLMALLTPWFLLVTGTAALILAIPERSRGPFLTWVGVCCLLTFGLEALGVATGKVFGAYHYGTVLGRHILGVPPVIGFNWVMIILAFSSLSVRLPRGRFYGPFLAAAAATLFDWIMEPVAIGLGYWTWEGGDIPLQNYAAWFLIALAMSLAYSLLNIKSRRETPAILAAAQLLFFGVLRVALFR
jgi:bisanhydrobacterioruberin hydratase